MRLVMNNTRNWWGHLHKLSFLIIHFLYNPCTNHVHWWKNTISTLFITTLTGSISSSCELWTGLGLSENRLPHSIHCLIIIFPTFNGDSLDIHHLKRQIHFWSYQVGYLYIYMYFYISIFYIMSYVPLNPNRSPWNPPQKARCDLCRSLCHCRGELLWSPRGAEVLSVGGKAGDVLGVPGSSLRVKLW